MCGLEIGENYNKSGKENTVVSMCPQEKEEYIKEALRYLDSTIISMLGYYTGSTY